MQDILLFRILSEEAFVSFIAVLISAIGLGGFLIYRQKKMERTRYIFIVQAVQFFLQLLLFLTYSSNLILELPKIFHDELYILVMHALCIHISCYFILKIFKYDATSKFLGILFSLIFIGFGILHFNSLEGYPQETYQWIPFSASILLAMITSWCLYRLNAIQYPDLSAIIDRKFLILGLFVIQFSRNGVLFRREAALSCINFSYSRLLLFASFH